ncbi:MULTISPECIES: MerR family transcriptional regulator [Mycobacteroides]|uniref:MerR family transcriptional regulator n=1 Tax=Mycobacteroides saopaulense TaxID=1578165 RepID=A0A1S1JQF7_9MYCO|nr:MULTISPECIES: MerR family transcriptional regulator [Mycobacteroides]ALR13187.1 MerR family transcriptional regulator [Mycobacteroides saopaulense]OHT88480.1 MerR family transcriptional regulator [Mycobacteroides saopaulense]OHU13296.1 MerR family transcriptional regulator [Mycobacteroides saopaulense]ORB58601.1 MerR family transcriptional regulator [Mycobacteroides saopaulense]SIC47331.1 Putative transcriptional regulator, MerR family [Mycobacteroides abscessus subsp. abscessus]
MSTREPHNDGFPISHVAQRTGLSIDALRWFEREGLFPRVPRDGGGRRRFSEDDIERVQLMLRLRRTGMPVRDMRRFIELLAGGAETHAERLELLFAQRVRIMASMERLTEDLKVVDFKVAYYTESVNGASAQPAGHTKG